MQKGCESHHSTSFASTRSSQAGRPIEENVKQSSINQVAIDDAKSVLSGCLNNALDLEEATKPPDLEKRLANDNTDNKQVPPLDTSVCAFGCVAVSAFAHNDILLLILDLSEEFRQLAD